MTLDELLAHYELCQGADRGWSTDVWKGVSLYQINSFLKVLPRHGMKWNGRECYDLLDAYTLGVPIADIAWFHQRTVRSIDVALASPHILRNADMYMKRNGHG